ncbi:reverse transcriptase domain-containing protein, partial [Klebsiella pneumoniae]|uniref:reverse transcriptase domain-containing protein n=1 Tax=Klebsiella pneumoniae TaxID=573 RepID=UPI003A7FECF4
KWIKAMDDEITSINKNNVWELVDSSKGRKPIGCKWVLKKKYNVEGVVEKFKARLVAKGFSQKAEVDYLETYSPDAKFASIRIILVISAYYDLDIWQMDIKNAFLNGELKESIYMTQLDGYVITGQKDKVYLLKKSLYEL